jgi:hypothetical protein
MDRALNIPFLQTLAREETKTFDKKKGCMVPVAYAGRVRLQWGGAAAAPFVPDYKPVARVSVPTTRTNALKHKANYRRLVCW